MKFIYNSVFYICNKIVSNIRPDSWQSWESVRMTCTIPKKVYLDIKGTSGDIEFIIYDDNSPKVSYVLYNSTIERMTISSAFKNGDVRVTFILSVTDSQAIENKSFIRNLKLKQVYL